MSILTCTVGTFVDFFVAGVITTLVVGAAIYLFAFRR